MAGLHDLTVKNIKMLRRKINERGDGVARRYLLSFLKWGALFGKKKSLLLCKRLNFFLECLSPEGKPSTRQTVHSSTTHHQSRKISGTTGLVSRKLSNRQKHPADTSNEKSHFHAIAEKLSCSWKNDVVSLHSSS